MPTQQKPLILDNGTTQNLPAGDQLEINAGSAALPALTIDGDPNTGIYSPGADQLSIATNGAQRVTVDGSGRVGVGTSAPSTAIELGSGQLSVPLGTVGAPSVTVSGDLNTGIYSPGADQLAISTNGTQRVAFGASGTVSFPATAQINLASGAKVTSNLTFDSTPPASYTANLIIGATATIALAAATPIAVTLTYAGAGAGTIIVSVNNSTTFTASYTTTSIPSPAPTVNQLITSLQTGSFTSVTLISGSGASQLPTSGGPYTATLSGATTYLYNVQSLKDPVLAQDAATKNYADTRFGGVSYSTFPANQGTNGQTLVTNGSGTLSWSTLGATGGGTGQTSYAVGDLLYANTTTSLAKLADVATGNALISGGVGVAPSWNKIGLATHVNGTLGVTNGGTGTTTQFTTGSVVFAGASGVYSQSNANFFWDNTNSRLGIGKTNPATALDVSGVITASTGVVTPIQRNTQTTSYTLALSDSSKIVEVLVTSPSTATVTVPLNSSVAFAIGAQILIMQTGTGTVSIAGAVGVTINYRTGLGLNLNGQWAVATLVKRATDTWVLFGDLV